MTNSEQKPDGLFDQHDSRVCNICLVLKQPSDFTCNDIGCRTCRAARRRRVKGMRADNIVVAKEYGKYVNGSQVRVLTMLAKGEIEARFYGTTEGGTLAKLEVHTILGVWPVSDQVAKAWLRSDKFCAAVDSVAKKYYKVAEAPKLLINTDFTKDTATPTLETRLNSIVGLVALVNCELSFGAGSDSKAPLRCQLSDSSGHVLATTHGMTPTEAMENMALRITNEDLGVVSVAVLKLVLGERGFDNQIRAS